jgi:hypothetical protein
LRADHHPSPAGSPTQTSDPRKVWRRVVTVFDNQLLQGGSKFPGLYLGGRRSFLGPQFLLANASRARRAGPRLRTRVKQASPGGLCGSVEPMLPNAASSIAHQRPPQLTPAASPGFAPILRAAGRPVAQDRSARPFPWVETGRLPAIVSRPARASRRHSLAPNAHGGARPPAPANREPPAVGA